MRKKTTDKAGLVPFMLCVKFLQVLGKCLGLSYKQISVIFNLYLQGGLLAASGALPLVATVWTITEHSYGWGTVLMIGCMVYFSMYLVGFIALLRHYHPPMEDAFDLCVNDLLWIAGKWHISYYAVNLIIFILWWLALIGINILTTYSILKLEHFA